MIALLNASVEAVLLASAWLAGRPELVPSSNPVVGGPLFVQIRRLLSGGRGRDGLAKRGAVLALFALLLGLGSIRIRTAAAEEDAVAKSGGAPPTAARRGEQAGRHTDQRGDPLVPDASMRLGSTRLRHSHGATAVAFSPDGRMLATGGWDGRVKLWNSSDGKLVHEFRIENASGFHSLAFSGDGRKLAAVGGNAMPFQCETTTGRELLKINYPEREDLHSVALTRDGRTMATLGSNGVVRVWDCSTGRNLFEYKTSSETGVGGTAVAFSPDGTRLAAARGFKLAVLDWKNQKALAEWPQAGGQATLSLAFAPDGKSFVTSACRTAFQKSEIQVWDARTGESLRSLRIDGAALAYCPSVALSADGKILATAHREKLLLWDYRQGRVMREIPYLDSHGPRSIAIAPDGSAIAAVGHGENNANVWKTGDGAPLLTVSEGHTFYVNALEWFADNRRIASSSYDRTMRLWDTGSGRATALVHRGNSEVYHVLLTPDQKTLISSGTRPDAPRGKGPQGLMRFSDITTNGMGVLGVVYTGYPITATALSPDGKILAVGSGSARNDRLGDPGTPMAISLWDVATRRWIADLTGHTQKIAALKFSKDGNSLMSVTSDGNLRRWVVKRAKAVSSRMLKDRPQLLNSAMFSDDLETVVTVALRDRKLQLLIRGIFGDEQELAVAGARLDNDTCMAYSPDQRIVAVTSRDYQRGTSGIQLVEVATGRILHEFRGDDDGLTSVKFSPDGNRLAAGTTLGTILIYEIPK